MSMCILKIKIVNMQGGALSPLYIYMLIIPGIITKNVLRKFNYIMSSEESAAAVTEFIFCSLKKLELYIFEN